MSGAPTTTPTTLAQRYFDLSNQDPYIQSVARPGQTIVRKIPYQYGVVVGTAVAPLSLANGPQTASIVTLSDSDFIVTDLSAGVNITANGDMKFNRNLTLQIQDQSTGKFFFNQPTVVTLVAGGGGFPFRFPAPRVVAPNVQLLVTMQNRDTTTDYFQGFITFGGTRIFYATDGS
jgi:hypothetical protein